MAYAVQGTAGWGPWGDRTVYRFLKVTAPYEANDPWPTADGRFDDGTRFTLYLSDTPMAAAAEFFRRNPELLAFQDALRFRMHEMDLEVISDCLDVRIEENANDIGFPFDRLTSSDPDPDDRYHECRELAHDVDGAAGFGIAYPSAAIDGYHNRVTFHEAVHGGWRLSTPREVAVPIVPPDEVRPLPS